VDDRFTQSAQRALTLASEEARSLGHNYIGTEHLLLGLLKEGAVIEVLGSLSIAPNKVREQVICVVGSKEAVAGDRRPLTPRARRALELASEEALRLGHDHVGCRTRTLGTCQGIRRGCSPSALQVGGTPGRGSSRDVESA
jgi:ATP-dependent Clp protease ATP-binding subunit ClpC